jgi:ABC-type glycerol-3-phosphate transport system substrate-binding protein
MHHRIAVFATMLAMVPFSAGGTDLVVWWDEPYYAEEGEALKEIIAAFEQESGKQVELVFYPQEELPEKILATFEAGQPTLGIGRGT